MDLLQLDRSAAPLRFPGPPAGRPLLSELADLDNVSAEARDTVFRDLSVFPEHILKLLKADGLRVVAVGAGQTLADTPALPRLAESAYQDSVSQAAAVLTRVRESVRARWAGPLRRLEAAGRTTDLARAEYTAARQVMDTVQTRFDEQELGFELDLVPYGMELERFARKYGLEDLQDLDRWAGALTKLNGGKVTIEDGWVQVDGQVVALPYTYDGGQAVPANLLAQARARTGMSVESSLGVHEHENRLVILSETYVVDPAPELGHYRVAIHEVGHGLDHALDRLLGAHHRDKIDAWYREDMALLKAGGEDRFMSDRARDNAREYFAEAVEAFCTRPMADDQDGYRPRSNHQHLSDSRPELFAYLEQVFDEKGLDRLKREQSAPRSSSVSSWSWAPSFSAAPRVIAAV